MVEELQYINQSVFGPSCMLM